MESYYGGSASNSISYEEEVVEDNEQEEEYTAEVEENNVKFYLEKYPNPKTRAFVEKDNFPAPSSSSTSLQNGGSNNKRRRMDRNQTQQTQPETASCIKINTTASSNGKNVSVSSLKKYLDNTNGNGTDEEREEIDNTNNGSPSDSPHLPTPSEPSQHDPYDLFCLSIAAHMRDMPKARAMQLQCKIMELMYNAEFPQYE
jgi:hypothetical protein